MNVPQLVTGVENHVATITLNRPEVMNAFTDEMREGLFQRLQGYAADRQVRCVVITGAGKAFAAGGDVASMAELQDRNDAQEIAARLTIGGKVVQLIRRMPQPVVAAVNGAAAGGGMNLALACDIRLGSDKAVFAESFVKIGLVPDWGGFTFLTRLVGTAKAMEVMMTGERIEAEEAFRLGLLNRLYPADRFQAEVEQFAARLAAGPSAALAAIKRGVYLGAEAPLAKALDFEAQAQPELFLSADAREGMRAFLEKRPPAFGAD
ncbi:MAG: enoyl-CoA hydratase-related protein [Alphaproteobacteria bacterium]|jgi:2-(1,2-epoxy-1,2-dihydrophenyl)acetyl-CoA isomerase|nr:enoyl-CoA hydratase-related protein [Alphaproteobacteria bacterium]